jgi:hypothetical protein
MEVIALVGGGECEEIWTLPHLLLVGFYCLLSNDDIVTWYTRTAPKKNNDLWFDFCGQERGNYWTLRTSSHSVWWLQYIQVEVCELVGRSADWGVFWIRRAVGCQRVRKYWCYGIEQSANPGNQKKSALMEWVSLRSKAAKGQLKAQLKIFYSDGNRKPAGCWMKCVECETF